MITAIMPTTPQRRKLWPVAIEMFARQERSSDIELIVGLDGATYQPWQERELRAIASKFGIGPRFDVDVVTASTLGAKRNEMIRGCDSPWIAFWDDDDWHAPERMSATVHAIVTAEKINSVNVPPRPPIIIGATRMLIHEITDPRRRTYSYEYTGAEAYYIGGTLCFERQLWERYPFAETGEGATVGDDAWWQIEMNKAIPDLFRYHLNTPAGLYCAFIHAANTANRQVPTGDPCWALDPEALSVIPSGELRRWEAAHAEMLVDRLLAVEDPRDVVGDSRESSL